MDGNSITVAVGSPDDLRSSIWRLWIQGDEVYFGARPMMPSLKVSLHKSGKWRIAWSKSVTRADQATDRVICRWRRPPYIQGWINAVIVFIDPYFPKQPFRNKAILDADIRWLPLARYGKILILRVAIATRQADLNSGRFSPDEQVLGRLRKSNGEHVLLILKNETPRPFVLKHIAKTRSDIKIHFRKADLEKADLADTTRALAFTPQNLPHENSGNLRFVSRLGKCFP